MARQTKAQIAEQQAAAAALHAEQQAVLKQMRADKRAKNAAAKADRIEAERVAAHCTATQDEILHADIDTLMSDFALPSPKRVLVGFILGVAASFTVGYGIGMVLSYVLAGILVLTSTAWIAFVLSALAWVVAMVAAWKIGGYVGGKVFSSVVLPDGLASRSYESVAGAAGSVGSRIGGWFSSTKDVAQAKLGDARGIVTGAFTKQAAA